MRSTPPDPRSLPTKLKATSLYLPPAEHKAVKLASVEHDMTISELLLATFRFWREQGAEPLEKR